MCSLNRQIMLLETHRCSPSVSVFHVVTIALFQASNSDESSLIVQHHQVFVSFVIYTVKVKILFLLSHNFCCLNRLDFVKTICVFVFTIFVTPFYHKRPVCAAEINQLSIMMFVWAYGHFLFCSLCNTMTFYFYHVAFLSIVRQKKIYICCSQ